MQIKNYQSEVIRTMGKLSFRDGLCAWSMGLAGEVGEVIEPIKKHVFHGKIMDISHLEKEIGDVLWYLAALCNELDIDMETVMDKNIEKLKERYPDGFVRQDVSTVDGFKRTDDV